MSRARDAAPLPGAVRRGAGEPVTALFAATLFMSAALMFIVEPLFGKLVLPRLGGAPAVWNTCVVFYQAVLLAGYAYAHLLATRLGRPVQLGVHLALVAGVCLALPVALPAWWQPPASGSPVPSLLGALTAGVGAPLFALAATPPLLQHWFSRTAVRSARDPYFLYAASNLGSVLALLAYPLLIEPAASLTAQRRWWSAGFGLLILFTLSCVLVARRAPGRRASAPDVEPTERLTWRRRGRWLALSAVPASLMLGVTTYASTDIAAVPLLWTLPLALYLCSFILAFARRRLFRKRLALALMTALTLPLMLVLVAELNHPVWLLLPLHGAALFALALLLHTMLADDRPPPARLTEFYFWIALGGVLGGGFNALLAPLLFESVAEYPAAVVAASLLAPRLQRGRGRVSRTAWLAPLVAAALTALLLGVGGSAPPLPLLALVLTAIYLAYAISVRLLHPGAAIACIWLAALIAPRPGSERILAERTFFGVLRVWNDPDREQHILTHGTTNHGAQRTNPEGRWEPLGYYHPSGPIGQVFAAAADELAGARVGVIGLGTGALAAYHQPGQRWTFYELDPAVARIARDHRLFTYLADCGTACDVVLGDGRLSLAREQALPLELLIVDAFSSDAIPVHMLTREALDVYLARLAPDGLLAFHISNRHLDLRPVVAALAADRGLAAIWQHFPTSSPDHAVTASEWIVMSRSFEPLRPVLSDPRWKPVVSELAHEVWTDDYSDIVGALRILDRPRTPAPAASAAPSKTSPPEGSSGGGQPAPGH